MRRLLVPDVGVDDLQVWVLDLDLEAALSDADWSVLSVDEQQKALRFSFHADRVRAVATRAALRRLLASELDCHPAAVAIAKAALGKPMLVGDHGIDFNVSHSGHQALIALCRGGAVGIDIECRTDTVDVASLSPLVFTPLERDAAEEDLDFFDRWVVKESVLKALGLGITEYLQAFSVFAAEDTRWRLAVTCTDWPLLCVHALQVSEDYAAALAATEVPDAGRLH